MAFLPVAVAVAAGVRGWVGLFQLRLGPRSAGLSLLVGGGVDGPVGRAAPTDPLPEVDGRGLANLLPARPGRLALRTVHAAAMRKVLGRTRVVHADFAAEVVAALADGEEVGAGLAFLDGAALRLRVVVVVATLGAGLVLVRLRQIHRELDETACG